MQLRAHPLGSALVAVIVFAATIDGHGGVLAASAGPGKAAFNRHGCWQCHDYNGQGWVALRYGTIIARTRLSLPAFKSFLRNHGAMPNYRSPALTNDELADIYAFLQSLPPPKGTN
jgi:cytochrome c553